MYETSEKHQQVPPDIGVRYASYNVMGVPVGGGERVVWRDNVFSGPYFRLLYRLMQNTLTECDSGDLF